jgi:hypothetical protein
LRGSRAFVVFLRSCADPPPRIPEGIRAAGAHLDRHFPGGRFARAWPEIRDEALTVARRLSQVPRFHEIMKEQTAISDNDGRDWRMFILKAYGIANPPNMAICPVLASIAAASPEVLSVSISFLAPGKHIPSHRGPFRGVLRFYLVLSMPLGADAPRYCGQWRGLPAGWGVSNMGRHISQRVWNNSDGTGGAAGCEASRCRWT